LSKPFGATDVLAWRLDEKRFETTWDGGEGSFRFGGRWNSKGVRAVYCSFDAATAILEVAAHKGFRTLDTVPHVLTSLRIQDRSLVHVVNPSAVPNPNWLRPGTPSAGQQKFGDDLLSRHLFVAIPSAVSSHSWNLIFDRVQAKSSYAMAHQEDFALDTRLHPPVP
jgi:RES domain-containing protein